MPGYNDPPYTEGSNEVAAATSGDGRSVWEFYADSGSGAGNAAKFLVAVALLRMDGEGEGPEGGAWIMENDDAYDTLNGLIGDARAILGWVPGQPPLDREDYQRHEDEC